MQYFSDCTETSQFTWGYYPPSKFKILLYFPEYDKFAVSEEVYERYAFDSYYNVDAKGLEVQSVTFTENITAVRNYDYTWELTSLFARIIATITIEVFNQEVFLRYIRKIFISFINFHLAVFRGNTFFFPFSIMLLEQYYFKKYKLPRGSNQPRVNLYFFVMNSL